jgi:hypothetical protein
LFEDRRKVYSDVLDPYIRLFAGIKNPEVATQAINDVQSMEYRRAAFDFVLIGADDVVRAFNDLTQYFYSLSNEQPDAARMMRLWATFLLAIRRNVGDPKTKLAAVEMLRSQITDIDKILQRTPDS